MMTEKDKDILKKILLAGDWDYMGVIAWVEMKIDEYQRQAVKDFLKPNSGVLLEGIRPPLLGEVKSADNKVLKSIKHGK